MNKYIAMRQSIAVASVSLLLTTVMLLAIALHAKNNRPIEVECFIQTMKGNPSVFHAVSCRENKDGN